MEELFNFPISHYAPWLDYKILTNSLLDYILTIVTFFVVWTALWFIHHFGKSKGLKFLKQTFPRMDNTLGSLWNSIKPTTLFALSLGISLERLHLHNRLDRIISWVIFGIITYQIIILVSQAVSFAIERASFGRQDPNDLALRSVRSNMRAVCIGIIWVTGALMFLSNMGVNITTFVTGLGIGGIAIALAAQNILGDAFNSLTIAIDKPFEIGDVIVVDQFMGTVENIGLKTTRLRSINGELIVVPNSVLTSGKVQNFKQMYNRRVFFVIGVTYETKLDLLKEIPKLLRTIIDGTEDCVVDRVNFAKFGPSSLDFEIVFYVQSPNGNVLSDRQQDINYKICEEFEKRGIQFAFPTQTIHVASAPQNSR